jgi:hypothetical protein
LPFNEAAVAPFVEVLPADGLASEVAGQELLDIGGGIKPIEECATVLVLGEAAVEFIAPGAREAGDFTVASHNQGAEFRTGTAGGIPNVVSGLIFIMFDSIHYVGNNDNCINNLCQLFLFSLFITESARVIFGGWRRAARQGGYRR